MKHILNGQEISPKDYTNIGLVIDYGDPMIMVAVNVDTITFQNEALEIIDNHLNTIGAQEGIPYDFELTNGRVLNYFVDFVDGMTVEEDEFGATQYKCKIKRRYSNEIFKIQADGYTFENLASNGVAFSSTAVQTPYVIIKNNQLEQGLSLSITLYVMSDALYTAIKDTVFMVQEFVQAVDPSPAHLIGAIAKLVAQIAYTVALIIAVVKLAQQLRELLLPKIRYYYANSLLNLIKLGIEYLGYELQSTLLDSRRFDFVLPVPLIKEKENIFDILENDLNFAFNKPYPTASDTIRTLGEAIESVLTTYNAKMLVYQDATSGNKIVRIERRDFVFNTFTSGITTALSIQGTRRNGYQLNTNEMYKRQYVKYLTDPNDIHTFNDFDVNDCEDSTEPIVVVNKDLVSIKGFNEVMIPFALGSRKMNLNWIENRLQDLFGFIDTVINALGGSSNLVQNINSRIGVLQISEQFFTKTKLLFLVGDGSIRKQPANYKDLIGAREIETLFHDIDFIGNNCFKVLDASDCNISDDQFYALQYSNYAPINGQNCELLRVEYLDDKNLAKITFKEPSNWAFNLQKKLIN